VHILLYALILFLADYSFATIYNVPQAYPTIQLALDACAENPVEGDTILVSQGTYQELFTVPPVSLCLMSNYIFTQDTLDIVNTVIDGDYQGTMITIDEHRPFFNLQGFTLTRGLGWVDEEWNRGGGCLEVSACDSLVLKNLVFHNMRSPTFGAVAKIRMYFGEHQSLTLKNLHFSEMDIIEPVSLDEWIFDALISGNLYMENIEVDGSQQTWPGIRVVGQSFATIKNITAHNFLDQIGCPIFIASDSLMLVEDFTIENNVFRANQYSACRPYVLESGYGLLELNRVTIRNNTFFGECGENDSYSSTLRGKYIQGDSIFFFDNHNNYGVPCGRIEGLGQLSNLKIIGNSIGDEEWIGNPEDHCRRSPMIEIYGCSVQDMIYSNNLITLFQRPPGIDHYSGGGTGIFYVGAAGEETKMSNCEFSNNFVDDRDVYEDLPGEDNYPPNRGRALGIIPIMRNEVFIDSCLFVNNRQPNHVPEWQWEQFGDRYVGSTIEIYSSVHHDSLLPTITFSNCEIRDNDDGGIFSSGPANVNFDNVQVINTERLGIRVESSVGNVNARNVLIDGTAQQDNWFGYPQEEEWIYQSAFPLLADTVTATNITITNCDVPYLIIGKDSRPDQVRYENFLLWNNQYDILEAADLTPEHLVEFHMSLLQDGSSENGNLIDIDPLFDESLGSPFLAANSPCIDAGMRGSEYNDLEDPSHPWFAQWPSQGGLRNDIGYTGGPGAAAFNFTGIESHSNPNSEALLPKTATLGNAYPNPFNPITTVEYNLSEMAKITVRVYNLNGQLVRTLIDDTVAPGMQRVIFNADGLASGVYLIEAKTNSSLDHKKVLLLK
jgi:hypothetical protein